jgi:hypothetical protein
MQYQQDMSTSLVNINSEQVKFHFGTQKITIRPLPVTPALLLPLINGFKFGAFQDEEQGKETNIASK